MTLELNGKRIKSSQKTRRYLLNKINEFVIKKKSNYILVTPILLAKKSSS